MQSTGCHTRQGSQRWKCFLEPTCGQEWKGTSSSGQELVKFVQKTRSPVTRSRRYSRSQHRGTIHACASGSSGPLSFGSGLQLHPGGNWQDNPLAGSNSLARFEGRDGSKGLYKHVDRTVRSSGDCNFGQRGTVHLGAVAEIAGTIGHQGQHNHGIPPSIKWDCGTVPQSSKERSSLCDNQIRVGLRLAVGLLGLRNAPRDDTRASTAEVLFGTTLRVPGMCFSDSSTREDSPQEQLQRVRTNVPSFTPAILNNRKFKQSPFIPKQLKDARFVFIRDDTLGKAPLSPRYSGPFEVVEKNWQESTFTVRLPIGKDKISLSRLKAAEALPSWLGGRPVATYRSK